MTQPSDSRQRQRALDPSESFIVQAPAGSGKTELLIQRYLALLAHVQQPEEIVAITFTRKAAAGMQGRIINALDRAREKTPPENDVAAITDTLAQAALVQDEKRGWQLADNPARLHVQTIDSLCARLTRQMPVLARLGARPETVEDATELYREAANSTLEELESREDWSDDIASLFAHLDNDMPKVRDLLSAMLARRDQWLRHVTGGGNRRDLEQALVTVVEDVLVQARQTIPQSLHDELCECLAFAAGNLAVECDTSGLPAASAKQLSTWQLLADLCLTQNNTWRKSVTVKQGFPAGPPHKAMKDRFQSLLSRLSGDDALRDALIETRYLPPVQYSDHEWHVITALSRLLVLADAGLRVLFGERNQIDFSGIASAAIEALGSPELPTDLALQLDYVIRHLLVDEFQDVSTTQLRLLQLITAGWSAADSHSLFLVGDPMQSIYRFREAELRIFLQTWEQRRLGQVPLTPLNITVNFRSGPELVSWVNRTFRQLMPERHDPGPGVAGFVPAEAVTGHAGGVVAFHAMLGRDPDREAGKVVSLVQTAEAEQPDGTIAILVRSRAQLAAIVPQLHAAGLPFQAVEIEHLGARPAIQDLLALTLALNRFADRIAWLALLRAPWCGLTLTDLFHLVGERRHDTIWQCMQDEMQVQKLSEDGQQRLRRCRDIVARHLVDQCRRSLRRSVEAVWMSLGGPATLTDSADLDNVQTYFDLLDQFDAGGALDEEARFFERINKLFAVSAAEDVRLQVMTIHKAKGLEFDTVILPGLDKGRKRDDPPLLRWEEIPSDPDPLLLLAPMAAAGERPSALYTFLQRREAMKQHNEEQRLLYVATTRARQALHLLGSVPIKQTADGDEITPPRQGSLLYHLWPQVRADFDRALRADRPDSSVANRTAETTQSFCRFRAGWDIPEPPAAVAVTASDVDLAADMSLPEFEWAGDTIKHIGTVTHRALQRIAEQGLEAWNEDRVHKERMVYQQALARLGVLAGDINWATDSVCKALLNTLADTRGRWILDRDHDQARNEYAISGLYRGRVINAVIDRTFVDAGNVRWIIDYKTSRHEGPDVALFLDQERERYQGQLEKYGELIRHMETRPVKLGLYFPLLCGWREITLDTGVD